ncbi:AmmeMemoRadiSam system radical SAM enzyme [Candidatus Shapirobacteria bacterium]|nr:AmmeMemoRadiSam system radical SAM enzyme [Candidatus Shapirobacteria bacterium]
MKEALLWEEKSNQAVGCFACHHSCQIALGRLGVCGVRENQNGRFYSLVYGRAAALGIDPVEKKPLYHFLPGSFAFSFGTLGCNFSCLNCQNWEISQLSNQKGKKEACSRLFWGENLAPSQIVILARQNQCLSIAYTYNEPTVFLEYALETMKLARRAGLKNIWVSNGFMSDKTLDLILPYLDAANIDIKSSEEKFYQKVCGAKLAPVLKNCQRLVKEGVWLEVTTLVIPTLSDKMTILNKIADFIREKLGEAIPWHLSAFSPAISWKLKDLPATPPQIIKEARQEALKRGLKYVYAGNLGPSSDDDTLCPACDQLVIKRRGYEIARFDQNGTCPKCGAALPGRWRQNRKIASW